MGNSAWEWLSLLGVPFTLAILGYWLQQLQKRRDAKKEKEQRYQEEEQAKEGILQSYFDRLSEVLIDKKIIATSAAAESATKAEAADRDIDDALNMQIKLLDAVRDVIRARTLSILRRFINDGRRKGSVIQFLIESEIIGKLNLDLSGAELDGADLSQLDLHGAHLSGVNFRGADLRGANLQGADLSKANLYGVDLRGANLFGSIIHGSDFCSADLRSTNFGSANLCDANLVGARLNGADLCNSNLSGAKLSAAKLYGAKIAGADLRGAKLSEAKLRGADFSGANLGGADFSKANARDAVFSEADLSGTDLSTVEELTKDQIQNAFLCKTKLPFRDLKPDRDCEKVPINVESDYLQVSADPDLSIPDNNPHGLTYGVYVLGDSHIVKDIAVSVDITHKFISDLIITVSSPNDIEVNLHNRTGASAPNIQKKYTVDDIPELRRFIGDFAHGEWVLKVADLGGSDVGKLNHFSISILFEEPD